MTNMNRKKDAPLIDPKEVHGQDEKKNLLKLTMEEFPEITDDISRERHAEKQITGSEHRPTGSGTPCAVVTGSDSGIGRGTAFALAEDGYDVVITYLEGEEDAREVQQYIRYVIGRNCHVLQLDVSDSSRIVPFIREARALLGGLDLLVNNAGIGVDEAVFETNAEDMDYAYRVDYRGPILLMQEAAKIMREDETRGSIINISSIHATHAEKTDGTYGALKAALSRATMTYALQYAEYGIRVNAILPGAILIDKDDDESHRVENMKEIPLLRSGLPRDIAHAVAFLASERASYITGVNLHVDGGMALLAYL